MSISKNWRFSGVTLEAITIQVFDPDAVTPEQVAELYRQARGKRRGPSRQLKPSTEQLALLELELIVAEAERLAALGEPVTPATWRWRPGPTALLNAWNARAPLLGFDELSSRQAAAEFQRRIPLAAYLPALRFE